MLKTMKITLKCYPKNFSSKLLYLLLIISVACACYLLKSTKVSAIQTNYFSLSQSNEPADLSSPSEFPEEKTQLQHIVFGIAVSSRQWKRRKEYIKTWWRPDMRGFGWIDKPVNNPSKEDECLPELRLSSDTSRFKYTHPYNHRAGIRITRIVSETVRLGMEDVRWFVMGDDDTFFVPDNLVSVLSKYDHNQFYYVGSSSESHWQNMAFSYNMAFGGGGVAISYPLAKELEKMQDRCIQRYPGLYGSDDRIHACMSELGVPLTKEIGFHQFDIHGNVFGLLAAHPLAPLVSLHHLDRIEPIFPNMNQVQALQKLNLPMELDSTALMQQSICYDQSREWTISVSWGYAVEIVPSIVPVLDMEVPRRTFVNWHKRADYTTFSFNSRPIERDPCQRPIVYMLSNALSNSSIYQTVSEYLWYVSEDSIKCKRSMDDNLFQIHRVVVYKKPDPDLWNKAPRRNCCRVLSSNEENSMSIKVAPCEEGEVIELHG